MFCCSLHYKFSNKSTSSVENIIISFFHYILSDSHTSRYNCIVILIRDILCVKKGYNLYGDISTITHSLIVQYITIIYVLLYYTVLCGLLYSIHVLLLLNVLLYYTVLCGLLYSIHVLLYYTVLCGLLYCCLMYYCTILYCVAYCTVV